jgi:putative MATE family efflux protein
MTSDTARLDTPDLTTGSIHRCIWSLAVPMVLETSVLNVAWMLDAYWVGQLGEAAIAAITVSATIRWVMNSLANGLGIGGMAMVARRTGEENRQAAAHATAQTILLGLAIALVLAVVGASLAPRILTLLGVSPEVLPLATTYLRITLGGMFTMVLLFVINALFRGAGEAPTAMRVLFLSTAVIVVLEPILVLGLGPVPQLGIAGAAWAFILGYGSGLIMQLVILLRGRRQIYVDLGSLRPDLPVMGRIIRIALPSTVQMTLRSSSRLALVTLVGLFGTSALAAYGVTNRLLTFAILPCFGFGNAGGTLVGQNLGARDPQRAEDSAWWVSGYAGLYTALVVVLIFTFAPHLVRLFVKDPTPAVLSLGTEYLRIVSPSLLAMTLGIVLGRALDGAGNTVPAMVVNLVSLWGVEVGVSYLLSTALNLGATGIWWGRAIAGVVNGLMFALWFRLGRWKGQRV